MTVSGSGDVYVSSYWFHAVSKVSYSSDFSGFLTAGELGYAEEGGIGHIFSESGLHRSTVDLDSGVELLTFGYDTSNRLASITDRFGNDTTIQRDASGVPTSITSPDGIITSLTVDADNNLRQVTYPDSSFYAMDYTPGGLMTDEYHPDGSRFTRIFDANGRVIDALDPEGGHWTFDRQTAPDGTATVSVLSGEGDQITYVDSSTPTGEFSSVITAPDGSSSTVFQPDGALSLTQQTACGTEITSESGMDSEFKYRYSRGSTTTAPSGLSVATGRTRIYADTDVDGNPDLITDTVTTNGKVSTVVNDTIAGTVTATSPTGRTVMSYYDPVSLLTSRTSTQGLLDTDFVYDPRGRLTDVTVGTRTTSFAYDTNGYLDFMTTPDNRTFDYAYDVMGRLTGEVRPDGSGVSYSYDNNGNMTVLVNPNLVSHGFSYTANDQRKAYDTPISGSYTYTYDKDRRLSSVTYPSGQGIGNFYLDGNLDSTVTPEGTISYSYDCGGSTGSPQGGKLGSVTKGTESTSYTYDGSLTRLLGSFLTF